MGFIESLTDAKQAADQAVVAPDVLAAIGASLNLMLGGIDPELVAAVAAAIVHAHGGSLAVRFKRSSGLWAAVGRQKLMDSRQLL